MTDETNNTIYQEAHDAYTIYNRLELHFNPEVYAVSLRRYENELSQSEKQNNHVAAYITILSLDIVGLSLPISNYRDLQPSNYTSFYLFIIFFLLAVIFVAMAIVNLCKHQIQTSRGYRVISSPSDIRKYYEDYYKYYVDNEFIEKNFTSPEDAANIALMKELIVRYNECTDKNIEHNEFKMKCLRALKINLLMSVLFFAFGYFSPSPEIGGLVINSVLKFNVNVHELFWCVDDNS